MLSEFHAATWSKTWWLAQLWPNRHLPIHLQWNTINVSQKQKTPLLRLWVDAWMAQRSLQWHGSESSVVFEPQPRRTFYQTKKALYLLPGPSGGVGGIFAAIVIWSFLWSSRLHFPGRLKGMWLLQCNREWTNPGISGGCLGHNILHYTFSAPATRGNNTPSHTWEERRILVAEISPQWD